MSKKVLIIISIIIVGILWWGLSGKIQGDLLSPKVQQSSKPSPSPENLSSPQAPKTFKYDSSTDLKKELESINPQILEEDFEGL